MPGSYVTCRNLEPLGALPLTTRYIQLPEGRIALSAEARPQAMTRPYKSLRLLVFHSPPFSVNAK